MLMDIVDINRRGDENFDGLNEVEKNLYCLLLFQCLYEMEGMTHFFSHHFQHLPRVLSFMEAVKAPNRKAVRKIAEFLVRKATAWHPTGIHSYNFTSAENRKLDTWDKEYYSHVETMWGCVREFLRERHGAELPP
jgi:hypothetical protein